MNWIKLPSNDMINIDAFAFAKPFNFNSVESNIKLMLQPILGADFTILKGEDAKYVYYYLEYIKQNGRVSDFSTYLESNKNKF